MSSLSSAAASSWFTRLGTAYRSGRSISRAALLLLASGTRLPAACAHLRSHASSILRKFPAGPGRPRKTILRLPPAVRLPPAAGGTLQTPAD